MNHDGFQLYIVMMWNETPGNAI